MTPSKIPASVQSIIGYLATLAAEHPDFVSFILELVRAARNARDPWRAAGRRFAVELAKRFGEEGANRILGFKRLR